MRRYRSKGQGAYKYKYKSQKNITIARLPHPVNVVRTLLHYNLIARLILDRFNVGSQFTGTTTVIVGKSRFTKCGSVVDILLLCNYFS